MKLWAICTVGVVLLGLSQTAASRKMYEFEVFIQDAAGNVVGSIQEDCYGPRTYDGQQEGTHVEGYRMLCGTAGGGGGSTPQSCFVTRQPGETTADAISRCFGGTWG